MTNNEEKILLEEAIERGLIGINHLYKTRNGSESYILHVSPKTHYYLWGYHVDLHGNAIELQWHANGSRYPSQGYQEYYSKDKTDALDLVEYVGFCDKHKPRSMTVKEALLARKFGRGNYLYLTRDGQLVRMNAMQKEDKFPFKGEIISSTLAEQGKSQESWTVEGKCELEGFSPLDLTDYLGK